LVRLYESQGLIATRVGRGTVVSALTDKQLRDTRADLLCQSIAQDVRRYRELGFSQEEVLETVRSCFSKE
jgi:DNA-binding transcriptional regulator YhcF (GntR family)